MQINQVITTIVAISVATIVIVMVAIPIISSISDKETFNTGYEDQLRYSRISTDDDISISITFVENENHLYIDGVDYTDLVRNRGTTDTPIIMSDTGLTFAYQDSAGQFTFTTHYWNPESDKFDSYGGYSGTKEYSIEIENETVTHTGFNSALKEPHVFNHGYILDYDGRYGLYSSTGDATSIIAANSDDYLIELADHSVPYDLITAVNGSVSSQYSYNSGGTFSSEINATADVTEDDGVMNYTLPIKSTQSDEDTEYMTVGPISIIQGDLDPTLSSLISTIPLIMIIGLLTAVAGITVLHLRR